MNTENMYMYMIIMELLDIFSQLEYKDKLDLLKVLEDEFMYNETITDDLSMIANDIIHFIRKECENKVFTEKIKDKLCDSISSTYDKYEIESVLLVMKEQINDYMYNYYTK
jgi:hypothetical protein